MSDPIAYAGSPLDRENLRRRSRDWLEEQGRSPASRYLPLFQLQPLLKLGDVRELAWAKREFFEDLDPLPEPVLLGTRDGVAHYAVDVSAEPKREPGFGVMEVIHPVGAVAWIDRNRPAVNGQVEGAHRLSSWPAFAGARGEVAEICPAETTSTETS